MFQYHTRGSRPSGVIFCAFFTFAAIACAGTYSGGTGTAEDPYKISTVADWQLLTATSADWGKDFILLNDIEFGMTELNPIGNSITPFMGLFEGNGKIVRRIKIKISSNKDIGLWGNIGNSGIVRNLGIEEGTVNENYNIKYVGILCGRNSGNLLKCFAIGKINYKATTGGIFEDTGNFWDTLTSTTTVSAMGTEKTTIQMQSLSTFSSAGWDFTDTDGDPADWQMPTHNYPRFFWEKIPSYSGGNGTRTDPFRISTVSDWQTLIGDFRNWEKSFILLNDIDFGGIKLAPVAADTDSTADTFEGTRFTGILDGTGHTLSNFTIQQPNNYVGLIGLLDTGGQIRNLGVNNMTIIGRRNVGGLVGFNKGSVTLCYANGKVSGNSAIGGLVGYNSPNRVDGSCGTITACYATGTVNGYEGVGGLVGSNYQSTITTCYAACVVSSTKNGGGLVGGSDGMIWACFWDSQTSGQVQSDGGIGLTTEQMRTMSIFQNAGWGGNNWIMNDGEDYPRLAWENTDGIPIPEPGVVPLLGSGTEEDPYRISTPDEFALLSRHYGILDKHIQLTANLDLDGIPLYPIGEYGPFTGIFDGNGHTLTNGIIDLPEKRYIGLFGIVGSGGQIRNLGVENVNISGGSNVGGLVGLNVSGTILNCYSSGIVSGHRYVGGLVGYNDYGTITASYATGAVEGIDAGGLVGLNDGTITDSYATGTVNGWDAGWDVGGLVGYNYGAVTTCYASGAVSGTSGIGGLVGVNWGGTITACYATGTVSGSEGAVGGLVGEHAEGKIIACYATGTVSTSEYARGLASGNHSPGTIWACFWDTQTTGQARNDGGRGLTTMQMRTMSIFQNAGWADKGWVMKDGEDYPRLEWENTGGTPIPPAVIPFAGNGTAEDPYRISTVEEFALMHWYSGILNSHIQLTANLDLSGIPLNPIGDFGPFTGVFDGNGHSLSNGVINQPEKQYIGLFGFICSGGQIRNLGVENVNIIGRDRVGGLVGYNEGIIITCHATGIVSGSSYVGGLVGWNYNGRIEACYANGAVSCSQNQVGGLVGKNGDDFDNMVGTIKACYASGTVSGSRYYVGGLVGYNDNGTIEDSYASGVASGSASVGGLVGDNNYGTITSCYATGTVSGSVSGGLVGQNIYAMTTACFWDTEASGTTVGVAHSYSSSNGIYGKTTGEMKTLATFMGAGWDFVGEAANGTADVWRMCADGVDYPRLSWEFSQGGDMDCPDGVGMEDLVYFAGRWMANTPSGVGAADADGSGKVDLGDFTLLSEQWMK